VSTDIERLAEEIARRLHQVPVAVDLWGVAEVARYLKVSERQVRERYAIRPDFPPAIRLGGRGPLRWRAIEVIRWAERQFPYSLRDGRRRAQSSRAASSSTEGA